MHSIFVETDVHNTYESETMKGILKEAKFKLADSSEKSDLIIYNIGPVKDSIKDIGRAAFREEKCIVAGCFTKERIREIRKKTHEASLIDTQNLGHLIEVVEETVNGNVIGMVSQQGKQSLNMPNIRHNKLTAIVPLISGCSDFCHNCTNKLGRGELQSHTENDILLKVKEGVNDGCTDIHLGGQDIASYGTEKIWRSSLPELISKIIEIPRDFRVRCGLIRPHNIRPIFDEMINLFKDAKLYKRLHLPFYSGSDSILTMMKKTHSIEDFLTFVRTYRTQFPHCTFITDVVVGFPGESDADFQKSLEMVKDTMPDRLNIYRFNASPIKSDTVNKRIKLLSDIHQNISRMNNERWLGWVGECTVSDKRERGWIVINIAHRHILILGDYKLGEKVRVKVTNFDQESLKGEVL